jgi:hypothetical protein
MRWPKYAAGAISVRLHGTVLCSPGNAANAAREAVGDRVRLTTALRVEDSAIDLAPATPRAECRFQLVSSPWKDGQETFGRRFRRGQETRAEREKARILANAATQRR